MKQNLLWDDLVAIWLPKSYIQWNIAGPNYVKRIMNDAEFTP